jgi:hypothetical protein
VSPKPGPIAFAAARMPSCIAPSPKLTPSGAGPTASR